MSTFQTLAGIALVITSVAILVCAAAIYVYWHKR
jgi:hypothetical protein